MNTRIFNMIKREKEAARYGFSNGLSKEQVRALIIACRQAHGEWQTMTMTGGMVSDNQEK